ncbi:hypothetical protein EG329_013800 [Mollisiaceae sp. DMI_Dod_QoI]|nr:hypothetical protein EG329_013800 [Helotiales sp. DMI_Dod_QoI]
MNWRLIYGSVLLIAGGCFTSFYRLFIAMGLAQPTTTFLVAAVRFVGGGIIDNFAPFFPSEDFGFVVGSLNLSGRGRSSAEASTPGVSAEGTVKSPLPGQKAFEDAAEAFRQEMAKRDAEEKDILRELLGATNSDASTISSAQATDAGPSN